MAVIALPRSAKRLAEVDTLVDRLVAAFDASGDEGFKAEVTERMKFLVARRAALAAGLEFELAVLASRKEAA